MWQYHFSLSISVVPGGSFRHLSQASHWDQISSGDTSSRAARTFSVSIFRRFGRWLMSLVGDSKGSWASSSWFPGAISSVR